MMLTILVPLLMALVGLLMYILASNGKVQRLGEIMFLAGMIGLAIHAQGMTARFP